MSIAPRPNVDSVQRGVVEPAWCKECLGSRSDRSRTSMSERLSATRSTCFTACLSTLDRRLPLNHQCRIPANESLSFLPSQPPLSLFIYLHSFSFLSYSGQPRSTLSRSHAVPVRPQYNLWCLYSIFTDIFLFIRRNDVPYTLSLKTHKREEKEKRKDTLIKLIQKGGDMMVIPSSKSGSLNIASVPTEE